MQMNPCAQSMFNSCDKYSRAHHTNMFGLRVGRIVFFFNRTSGKPKQTTNDQRNCTTSHSIYGQQQLFDTSYHFNTSNSSEKYGWHVTLQRRPNRYEELQQDIGRHGRFHFEQ